MPLSQHVAEFHFTKRNKIVGRHFDGVIKICNHTVKFGGRPLTFWYAIAQLIHTKADLDFLIEMTADRDAFIVVQLQGTRQGRGVCVANDIAPNNFKVAIAGCESFSESV